jgi:hypothetical protein
MDKGKVKPCRASERGACGSSGGRGKERESLESREEEMVRGGRVGGGEGERM